jgi:DNA-binding MarR family transcriptional regulator
MATPLFDELIHPSTRLSIVALLASTDWAEFSFVRDRLEMSDSALSKQFTTLEEAGYITIERTVSNRRRRVRVALTDAGVRLSRDMLLPCKPSFRTRSPRSRR